MLVAGIDIGSLATKAVIYDGADGAIISSACIPSGARPPQAGERVLQQVLEAADVDRDAIAVIVATGYGREAISVADSTVTEITCAARGAHFYEPETRAVIDIGGQDSKAIRVDPRGYPLDFALNDRCAAGTGRFLEVMAGALETSVDGLERLALEAIAPVAIGRTCTVFAESEIVGLLASGVDRAAIAAGLCRSVALRTAGLARQVGVEPRVTLIGGVALNRAIVRALSDVLAVEICVPALPQLVVATGAALVASDRADRHPSDLDRRCS